MKLTFAESKTLERGKPDILDKRVQYIGVFPFAFDDGAVAEPAIPTTIQLIPIGQWDHDLYGQILITPSDIREFVDNFDANVRKGVPITAGHEGMAELPAEGWISKVYAREDGLWGDVEWTESGKALLKDKAFKFFSPEFYREYEDPETHKLYRNVLVGGALTKSPYFKELKAIVFSEPKQIKKLFNDTMDINELVKKDIATLSDDEKAFVKSQKDTLTDEQKTHFTAIIDEVVEETEEEKTAREEKERGDANEAAGLNRDGSAKEPEGTVVVEEGKPPVQASEKVLITAGELAILRKKADEGAQAFAEAKRIKLDNAVASLSFSEKNRDGKFLPKSTTALRSFMESLSDAQSAKFTELMGQLPKSGLFSEVGVGSKAVEGTAMAEVEAKVAAKMSEQKLSYSEALKIVMSENEGLETRYDGELAPVKGRA